MNKGIIKYIISFMLFCLILFLFYYIISNYKFSDNYFIKKGYIEDKSIDTVEVIKVENIYTNTVGVPQGVWSINGEIVTTNNLIDSIEIGQSWGAISNIGEKNKSRITDLVKYMGYSEHIDNDFDCFYNKAAEKVLKDTKLKAPYYHQGLFGKEEWGNIMSGSNITNPDVWSTFNSDGCHIYTMAYALSATQKRLINPPEMLVLGWYSGYWYQGMGNSENVENLKTYLGLNVCTVSDDKENAKKEIDNIIDNDGVVVVYLGKPFSFGNYHWVCITDRVNEKGVDKYRIWTSTNIRQAFQVYTFDYLYSKRVLDDWVRIGVMP